MRAAAIAATLTLALVVACDLNGSQPASEPSPDATVPPVAVSATLTAEPKVTPSAQPSATPTATLLGLAPTVAPTTQPVTPSPAPKVVEPAKARGITDGLNVRAEPGLDYPVVGQLPNGAEIEVVGRTRNAEWLAIAGTGWVFYDPAWLHLGRDVGDVLELSRDSEPVIGPLYNADVRTGIPAVDAVIQAVTAGDEHRLSELPVFQEMGCSLEREFYLDPPLCPEGEPEGTPVGVLQISTNHAGGCTSQTVNRRLSSSLAGE